jgi:hypothetical protein
MWLGLFSAINLEHDRTDELKVLDQYSMVVAFSEYELVSKLVLKVSKPNPLKARVRYWVGGVAGIWNVKPRMYNGHRS